MEKKNILISFEDIFKKEISYNEIEKENGDKLIDEIIHIINEWIVIRNFKDINDQDFKVTRFNVNEMIKIRIDDCYETSLFCLKSSNYLKSDDNHCVEIIKLTDSKIYIGQNCYFQKGEKKCASYNYLIQSAEFHVIARWDGTEPKKSALSEDRGKQTKFIVVDILQELLDKEFYNKNCIQQIEKITDKAGNKYSYPNKAERNNLYPNLLTVECGGFKTAVNLVLYEKYKLANEFDIENIGFLKKNKDNQFSYQIDKLFSKEFVEFKNIDQNINALIENKKMCIKYLENNTNKIDNDLFDKLDLFSQIDINDDYRICVNKKLDQLKDRINIEKKRKKIFEKFFNKDQLYLCKVQNYQTPISTYSEEKGNYIKPRLIEMTPLGFIMFTNDLD